PQPVRFQEPAYRRQRHAALRRCDEPVIGRTRPSQPLSFAVPVESRSPGRVWFGHLLEISMSLNPVALNVVDAGAIRAVVVRGQQVAAAGYYFGYWFSRRRA
ncbi:hypothetical protein, partial [Klebsiella pneumoniae]